MRDNTVVATLPIKPQETTNIGMLLAPTIMDFIGNVYEAKRVISINTLNTYHEKDSQINTYLSSIDKNKINYDSILIDKDRADELIEIIDKLYKSGFLQVKRKNVIRCDCGKVDILEEAIDVNNAKLYRKKDEKMYCNSCNSMCKHSIEKVLVFKLDDKQDDTIMISPNFLQKDIRGISNSFRGREILVSKKRDTGYNLDTINGLFNIDIDFMWSNYFNLFEEENQILLASNHQLLIMYLMNYLARTTSNKKITFVANPYIRGDLSKRLAQYEEKESASYKKLFILYNLRWGQKDCTWSDTIIDYINGISQTKLDNLYKAMIMNAMDIIDSNSIDKQINDILVRTTNMQNNIKVMKKMYKEGKL